ncbi:MAG TPA: hypothetical protein VGD55_03780 [Acidothermaceae bacterium]
MYGWIWRRLPGGFGAKVGGCALLLVGVLALLFFVIFPWAEPRLPWNDVTVNSPSVEETVPSSSPPALPPPSALPGGPSVLPAG